MVHGVDRGSGDGGQGENPDRSTQPFGVSKTLSFYENPGLESTPTQHRRSKSDNEINQRVDTNTQGLDGDKDSVKPVWSKLRTPETEPGRFQGRPVAPCSPGMRTVGLITPPCAPRSKPTPTPPSVFLQPGARSVTLPRSWISSNYILVQKESLRDEDLVWL